MLEIRASWKNGKPDDANFELVTSVYRYPWCATTEILDWKPRDTVGVSTKGFTGETFGVFCSLTVQFPARDEISAGQQAGHQAAGLVVSLALSIIGGLLTGACSVTLDQTHRPYNVQVKMYHAVITDIHYWDI